MLNLASANENESGVISLRDYIAEQAPDTPYKLLILSHDDPLDPNETAPMVKKKAEELGITVFLAELMGCYMEDADGDSKLIYSYPVDDKGKAELPDTKNDVEYAKPFKINPKDLIKNNAQFAYPIQWRRWEVINVFITQFLVPIDFY